MTLPPTLTLGYWFALTPPPFAPMFAKLILITFVSLTVLGIIAQVVRLRGGFDKPMRRALARAGSLCITAGLIGLLLFGFEYERVQILTMRIAYLLLLAWFLWSAWRIYRYAAKDIPEIRQRDAEYRAFTKWLPKPKK